MPLDGFLGTVLIGLVISSVVFGITVLQVYLYFTEHSRNDGRFLKTVVLLLVSLDALQMALCAHVVYHYTITNFGDYGALSKIVWSFGAQPLIGDIIATIVQLLWAFRVYRLSRSKNKYIPAIICAFSLGQLATSFVCSVRMLQSGDASVTLKILPWNQAGLAAMIGCDLIIAVSMIYYLNSNRTDFAKTNRAINTLITYSLNTGSIHAAMAALALGLTTRVSHNSLAYAAVWLILCRLYSCSFLSILNSRGVVRSAFDGSTPGVVSASRFHASHTGSEFSRSPGLEIKLDTVVTMVHSE